MALMTYLLKDRNGTYHFRRIIPPALRPFMPAPWLGKTEWKLSLCTKKPAAAKVEASKVLRECVQAFDVAERRRRGEAALPSSVDLSDLSVAEIEADMVAQLLEVDSAGREDGDDRRRLQTPEERRQWPNLIEVDFRAKGMAEDHAVAYGESLEELSADYRRALSRMAPGIIEAELRAYLRRHGAPIDPASRSTVRLALRSFVATSGPIH